MSKVRHLGKIVLTSAPLNLITYLRLLPKKANRKIDTYVNFYYPSHSRGLTDELAKASP